MQNHISIQHFKNADADMVLLFYAKTSYQSAASTGTADEIVAAYNNDDPIGLYRLSNEAEVCVLRGFYVLPDYRNKGIGQLMLNKLNEILGNKPCYLICIKRRNAFYARAGFEVATGEIAAFVLARKNKYNNPEMNILVRKADSV